jgi:hypothetical protein
MDQLPGPGRDTQEAAVLTHDLRGVCLQGGIGPAGLASEDLHVLDFTDMDRPRWHRYGSNSFARALQVQVWQPISVCATW